MDEHFQLPKYLSVSVNYKYIGKYKPSQLGKHYELDWIDNGQYGAGGGFTNFPDRRTELVDLTSLFDKLGQSEIGSVNIPSVSAI